MLKLDSRALLAALATLAGVVALQPPARPPLAPDDGFSLERARETLTSLASAPRPRGSEHHERVRDYLARELTELGLGVELQSGSFDPQSHASKRSALGDRGAAEHSRLVNVLAKLPGQDSTGTILLMAHYDSVVDSPGAGDDGSGCVAVLEAMRVLSHGSPRNDVLALFSDGEEEGLRGARLFAEQHPLFAAVDVVLNFESIGNGGPALMFETGVQSGGLIDLWAAHAPEPRGNTIAPVVYGWLPNDTDFSLFRDAGKRGLNFAIAGGSGAYHRPSDTSERFEERSLAHLARTAIALSGQLAGMDLHQLPGGERCFDVQPLFGNHSWSHRAHLWIGLGCVLLWGLTLLRDSKLTICGWLRGLGTSLGVAAVAGLAAFGLPRVWFACFPPDLPLSYDAVHLLLAAMVLCASLAALLTIAYAIDPSVARQRELLSASPLTWVLLFGWFAWIDLGHLGAAYPLAWAAGGACLASVLRLRGRSALWALLAVLPALVEVGPILGQLVQLSSQELGLALQRGSFLIGLGILLVQPLLTRQPASRRDAPAPGSWQLDRLG